MCKRLAGVLTVFLFIAFGVVYGNSKQEMYSFLEKNGIRLAFLLEYEKDNKEIVLAAIENDGLSIAFASDRLKRDKEIALAALNKNKNAIFFVSEDLRDCEEIMLASIDKDHFINFQYASNRLKEDRSFVLEAVKKTGAVLQYTKLRRDKEIVLEAVKNSYRRTASFPADKEIVLEAVKHNGDALLFASEELQKEPMVIETAIKTGGCDFYSRLHDKFKNDEDVILSLLKYNYKLFIDIPFEFANDKKFVIKAIQINAKVYRYLPIRLKSDLKIFKMSVEKEPKIIYSAPQKIKSNKNLMLKVLKKHGFLYDYMPEDLKKDKDIILAAAKSSPYTIMKYMKRPWAVYKDPAIKAACSNYNKCKESILAAIKRKDLTYVPRGYRDDREIMFEVLKFIPGKSVILSERLKHDKMFIIDLIKEWGANSQDLLMHLRKPITDKEIALTAVVYNINNYKYLSKHLTKDPDVRGVCLDVMQVLNFLSPRKNNKNVEAKDRARTRHKIIKDIDDPKRKAHAKETLLEKIELDDCPDLGAEQLKIVKWLMQFRGFSLLELRRNYKSFAGLLKKKVFLPGPHDSEYGFSRNSLDKRFGHYNKEFLKWILNIAIPNDTQSNYYKLTNQIINKEAKNLASELLRTKYVINNNPEYFKVRLDIYKEFLVSDEKYFRPERRFQYHDLTDNIKAVCLAFWIRRTLDGTAEDFLKILEKFLYIYDNKELIALKTKYAH